MVRSARKKKRSAVELDDDWLYFHEHEGFSDRQFDHVGHRDRVDVRGRVIARFSTLINGDTDEKIQLAGDGTQCSVDGCTERALKTSPHCARHRVEEALAGFDSAGIKYIESRWPFGSKANKSATAERNHYEELWKTHKKLGALLYQERRRAPWSDERATEWIMKTDDALKSGRQYILGRLKFWTHRAKRSKGGNDPDRDILYRDVLRIVDAAGLPLNTSRPGPKGGGKLVLLLAAVLNPIFSAAGEQPLSEEGVLKIIQRAKRKADEAARAGRPPKWRAAGT